MNKLIKGRRYDTTTAKSIATCEKGGYTELFRKRGGEYFLVYWTVPKNNINPIDYDEAKEFAKANLDPDAYEKAFGTVGEKKVYTSVSLPPELLLKLNNAAAERNKSKSDILAKLIQRYL